MSESIKEWIRYSSAIVMIASGVILAFLSFFLNNYDIADGILWYIGQALTYAGAVFGLSVYFKTQLGLFRKQTKQEFAELFRECDKKEAAAHNEKE